MTLSTERLVEAKFIKSRRRSNPGAHIPKVVAPALGCFVATLLAMTGVVNPSRYLRDLRSDREDAEFRLQILADALVAAFAAEAALLRAAEGGGRGGRGEVVDADDAEVQAFEGANDAGHVVSDCVRGAVGRGCVVHIH